MEYVLTENQKPECGAEVIIVVRRGTRLNYYLATYEGGPYFDAEGRLFAVKSVVAWMLVPKYEEVIQD